jgi:hypothetical protein
MLALFETNGSSPPEQNEAYQHGYVAGHADAWIARLSEYACYGELLDPAGSLLALLDYHRDGVPYFASAS